MLNSIFSRMRSPLMLGLSSMLGVLAWGIIASSPVAIATDIPAPESSGDRPILRQIWAYENYQQVVQETADMVADQSIWNLVQRYGLQVMNITWEDTGRYQNSTVGPNISDMTIQVQQEDPITGDLSMSLMPVIRYPNFTDQTADLPIDQFQLLVGNHQGEDLEAVPLRDVLDNLRDYLTEPDSWDGDETSLLAERDTHVMVSAQACFLPIPQEGMAQFNPVLFNYQSYEGDPAVLTILATREGTSITVIDNTRDRVESGWMWGQRLFFNRDGDRASFTGQRISDFQTDADRPGDPQASVAGEEGLNMVMLIQVPLRQQQAMRFDAPLPASPLGLSDAAPAMESERQSNVEAAVIGHGDIEGPFTEIDGLSIERDPRFPIRVTVQFYKATSNGVVSETDVQQIRQQIARVYEDADYVGSLVVDGSTGRPTEHDGEQTEPENWWEIFWQHYRDRIQSSD
ncbi:hypothetical protein [Vacuolonema iberomarrocanum]|uniref:hypothetical protein n=1 Tax=Vacuolonema iberomarrocanum TaxID=3454632 RepID=UPI003F6DA770